ncbi:MAG: aminoacyl-tRNA hydrolase [Candidatus Omnitrophota bacterium]
MKLIVGLGNPGKQYARTRHNAGFLVLEALARRKGVKFRPSSSCKALEASFESDGETVYLLMPLTFMNLSGRAVKPFIMRHGLLPEDMLVVVDDYQLDFGRIRLRRKGSGGGHNGMDSVITALATEEFPRLRFGVGAPPGRQDAVDYVLGEFGPRQKAQLEECIGQAAECCLAWMTRDIEDVMSHYNKRKDHE